MTDEQRALSALRKMKAKLDALEAERSGRIAVVGLACRFPGRASSPSAFWRMLREGVDGVIEVPSDRWNIDEFFDPDPDTPGKMCSRWGGFLERIDGFDADFFGLPPREVERMDPQHRLALEVAWEALEDAAIVPRALAGARTGVFFGVSTNDYFELQTRDSTLPDVYTATGGAHAFLAGRLSFLLNLTGPSLTLDTVCSSSLVALHLACQSLRARESDVALVGGVNVVVSPLSTSITSKFHALSVTGRCRAFDARADGFVRGEGCGVVVLRRLGDALAARDNIWAVIRGSAVNHDGRSVTLTSPNASAQRSLIEDALSTADIPASSVSFVETHGTGTPLGDPIEVEALLETYGRSRKEGTRCALGAVKTNLGHLEAAAGIAGFIKTVLALKNRAIPPNLHFTRINPRIRLENTSLYVPTECVDWKSASARVAAVSSFGMSGTNAHAILEEWTGATPREELVAQRPLAIVLSGKTPRAVQHQAQTLAAHLDVSDTPLLDVAFTAATGRTQFEYRTAVVAGERHDATRKLREVASGDARMPVASDGERPRVALLFTGQGAQYVGMGRLLFERSETFRGTVARCDSAAHDTLGASLIATMFGGDGARSLDDTTFAQPALYALECGLVEILRSWGVVPEIVVGHSVGEYAAAYTAGVFPLEDGAKLIACRARLMGQLPRGGMRAVFESAGAVREQMLGLERELAIAALNGPKETVISGSTEALARCVERLEAKGIRSRPLTVSHAFHSPMMASMLDEFERVVAGVHLSEPRCDLASNLSGEIVAPRVVTNARYWRDQVREPVRFAAAVDAAAARGAGLFVELGPKPVLSAVAKRLLRDTKATVLSSLRDGQPDDESMETLLGALHVHGVRIDWERVFAGRDARRTPLPTYPFERQRYWFTAPESATAARTDAPRSIRHVIKWTVSSKQTAPAAPPGLWLVCTNSESGQDVVRAMKTYGADARLIALDATEPRDIERAIRDALPREQGVRGVLLVLSEERDLSSEASLDNVLRRAVASCSMVLGGIRAVSDLPEQKVWLLTNGAVATRAEEPQRAGLAAAWGLGRCAALESGAVAGLVDTDFADERACAQIARLICGGGIAGEREVAIRDDTTYVPRLVSAPPSRTPCKLSPMGSYLVVGGLGALGRHVARWLAERGARHVVLASRSADTASGRDEIAKELAERGVDVVFARADVTDVAALEAIVRACDERRAPVCGAFHLAGVASSATVDVLDVDALRESLRPKLLGSLALQRALRGHQLDAFVCFASIAGVLGTRGLGAYAAANHAQDAVVQSRRAAAEGGLSVDWGPWEGDGMADESRASAARSVGIRAMPPQEALAALEEALEAGSSREIVVRADWSALRSAYDARGQGAIFSQLCVKSADEIKKHSSGEIARALLDLPEHQRLEHAIRVVRAGTAEIMRLKDPALLGVDRGLFDAGIDSLMAVELTRRLEIGIGKSLPPTLAMDCPTVRAIAAHLVTLVASKGTDGPQPALSTRADEPIAIVGMGCRLPGADSPERFWDVLSCGVDATRELLDGRWPQAGSDARPRGGFLDRVDKFDAGFFGISPREAASMDPQQRFVLEVAWEALEDAAVPISKLRGTSAGVFVGVSVSDYARGRALDPSYVATGNSLNVVAGRVSYALGLHGPSLAVDTACSSSLVALHLACEGLRAGDCDIALAGGVNLILSLEGFTALTKARMLAADGRCKTFDEAADGYARGEGCGMLVLKRLSDAERDRDRVLAIVRATAVNQNGAGAGLTVPSSTAQQRLYRQAIDRAGLRPADIGYIEAHGTGTSLGDPIELQALHAVYGEGRDSRSPVLVGSVKTNIGHLESAAGIAGAIKAVLALEHGAIPPHLHFKQPSSRIPWSELNVAIPTTLTPWGRGEAPRRAAISSFGFSGTNAHAILEEAPRTAAPDRAEGGTQELALVLSARSARALQTIAARLSARLDKDPSVARDVCFTANIGRSRWTWRAAVRGQSADELSKALDRVASCADPSSNGAVHKLDAPPEVVLTIAPCIASGQRILSAAEMLDKEPALANAIDGLEAAARSHLSSSASSLRLRFQGASPGDAADERIVRIALAVAEAQTWRRWGIAPSVVRGSEDGRYVAAIVDGTVPAETVFALVATDRIQDRAEADSARRAIVAKSQSAFSAILPNLQSLDERRRPPAATGLEVRLSVETHAPANVSVSLIETFESGSLQVALSQLDVLGVPIDWNSVASARGTRCSLPTYPFERERHWVESAQPASQHIGMRRQIHGRRLRCASSDIVFDARIGIQLYPFLADHRVFGHVVVPGSFHVAAVLSALSELGVARDLELHDLVFAKPLVLHEEAERALQIVLCYGESQAGDFRVLSAELAASGEPEGEFEVHVQGRLRAATREISSGFGRIAHSHGLNGARSTDVAAFYGRIGEGDLALGPSFRWLQSIEVANGRATSGMAASISVDECVAPLFPGLIDSCFQLPAALVETESEVRVPIAIERVRFFSAAAPVMRAIATVRESSAATVVADVALASDKGQPIALFEGVTLHPAEPGAFLRSARGGATIFVERWISADDVTLENRSKGTVLLLARSAEDPLVRAMRDVFEAGHTRVALRSPDALAWGERSQVDLTSISDAVYVAPDAEFEASGGDAPLSFDKVCAEVARLVATCLSHERNLRVWLVSREATGAAGGSLRPMQAALWGLSRTIALEAAGIWGGIFDLPSGSLGKAVVVDLCARIRSEEAGAQRAWRNGHWLAPAVERADVRGGSFVARPDRTYLVTGAFGGLGRLIAEWLVRSRSRHLVLLGHTPRASDSDLVDALRAQHATVVPEYADVASVDEVASVLARVRAQLPPLAGVVHAAGLLDDGLVANMAAERFARVAAVKIGGARAIDTLTADDPLDFFAVFSSASALLGSPGQANYAAANAVLDAWARRRRSEGRNVIAIGWGPWAERGMAARAQVRPIHGDIPSLPVATGLSCFEQILAAPAAYFCVLGVSPHRLPSRLASHVLFARSAWNPTSTHPVDGRAVDLRCVPPAERRQPVERELATLAAQILGVRELDATTPLAGFGMDSLMAVELKNGVEVRLGAVLPLGALVQGPSVRQLADAILERLTEADHVASPESLSSQRRVEHWEEGEL
jgi:acyl transferase domain-containing protein/acyl carrier protein